MPEQTDIIISELSNAPQVDDSAVFPLTQDNGGSPATFKATMSQIAGKIGEGTTFANLNTTSKNIIGAINEIAGGGGGSTEIIGTASGSIATFNDGGNNIPMKSCEVAIVAQQASGTPSPSSPKTIQGFSSISTADVGGKNLFGGSDGVNYPLIIPANKTFSLSCEVGGGKFEYFRKDGTLIDYYFFSVSQSRTITCPETIYSVTITTVTTPWQNVQIEFGNAPTTYEAFKANNITTVPLGQTIYGGTAELVNGNGIKTHGYVEFDGSEDEVWKQSGAWFFIDSPSDSPAISSAGTPAICNYYENKYPSSVSQATDGQFLFNSQGFADVKRIAFKQSTIANITAWKSWLANNTLQVVYPLATPTAFTFTGANIPTLSGTNNIYANCGDIQSLEYFNENADEIAELVNVYPYEVSGVLTAGQTSITLSSELIKADSTIDIYTSDGTNYNSVSVSSGSVTIAFDEQQADLGVKVRIS